ncbi:PLP-dependent aminotransferase family protein [Synergistaceae bacterium OttesenSCG-928-D05]|nr:PLP-dependent aminotransferase family protein [Synergistaceae bacterium OttesenSCG-928-D05]
MGGNAWEQNYSQKVKTLRPSPIREILNVVKQPGMISFAGGMPAPEVFPVDEFFLDSTMIKAQGAEIMQYGTTEGDPRLRKFLAEWQEPRLGRVVNDKEMILTTGSQQALDLLGWVMIDPGSVVITEDPTYLSALSVFVNHGASFVTVPMDEHGMVVEKLPQTIEKIRAEGKSPKFIYTIVNFQNPAGATMSVERRQQLAEISERYGVPILEDDPYGYIRYDGEHLPSVFSFDKAGNTIYAGSFSKILSPGTRIGWVCGNENVIRQLAIFKQFTDLCSSPITQALAYEYCKNGYLDSHLPVIIDNYRVKRDAMEKSLIKHLTPLGVTWVKPEGGFFYWLDFGGINASLLAKKALEKQVAFIPDEPFCVQKELGERFGRVNFTYSQPDVIDEGVRRLAEAISEIKAGH